MSHFPPNLSTHGYTAGISSLIVNMLLFIFKVWVATVSGSIALMADAWHTLSDSLSSIVLLIGVRLSGKKADTNHPYGHGRWELIASILIGALLVFVGWGFLNDAWDRLHSDIHVDFGIVAIIVTIISIISKELLAQYSFHLARLSGSSAIKADAWHHRSDALSSVVILIGILLKEYFWWIDSALAAIVSLMLFHTAFEIIKEASDKLLGRAPSEKLKKKIEAIITNNFNRDLYPHHFHYHDYISHKELTLHIKLPPDMTVLESHDIAHTLESHILRELDIFTTIHIDPIQQ